MVHQGMWRYEGRYGTVTFLFSLAPVPSPPDPRPQERPASRLLRSGRVADGSLRYVEVIGALWYCNFLILSGSSA